MYTSTRSKRIVICIVFFSLLSLFLFLLVFNLNVQYLQQTVLVVCDGRSLYSLYPEGKEKKMFGTVNPFFSFSFFFFYE